ncbi:MAG: glycosyltransferase [Limisphaerales bacterium]
MEHGWVRQPRQVQFQTHTLVKGASDKKLQLRNLSARLGKVLTEFKPQAVFVPGWSCATAFIAHNWCNLNSVSTIVMSESNSWDEQRFALKEWVKRRLTRMYAAALVGGTAHKHYMVELGLPAERIFLGYDAVDNEYFARGANEVRSQKEEGRNRSTSSDLRAPSPQSGEGSLPEKYFLASARFVEKKNLTRLIEAYALYRQKAETGKQKTEIWDLVLLGDGPLRSTLNSQLSTLNLHGHVQMPGFKQYDELPAYYGLASAFVHASTTEQWGLVVNEAMASGLPVLVSNRCGCAMDLVKDGVNGFTFDPHNVEQLAVLMLKIWEMEDGRWKMGNRSSAFGATSQQIISSWSPGRFGQGVSAAVERALGSGAQRISLLDKVLLQVLTALT